MKHFYFKINNENFNIWYLKGPKGAPVFHWAHANGFNAPIYENLLRKLSQFCHVYAWDARAHGLSSKLKLPVEKNIYKQYVQDFVRLINLLYDRHTRPIIVAGHSFGATVSIKAEAQLRGKISKLILADPVLFTPLAAKVSQVFRIFKFKNPKAIYLAENAARRQNMWISKDEAFSHLSQKRLFKNWDSTSMNNYIKYGLTSSTEYVKLSCPPSIESLIFKESETQFLSKEITDLSVDTYIYLASKDSPAFAKTALQKSRKIKSLVTLKSTNHLFPIEKYEEFSKHVINHIKL